MMDAWHFMVHPVANIKWLSFELQAPRPCPPQPNLKSQGFGWCDQTQLDQHKLLPHDRALVPLPQISSPLQYFADQHQNASSPLLGI